jgi:hypothetical protein
MPRSDKPRSILKIGKRIGRGNQSRLAHRAAIARIRSGPLGMVPAGLVVGEARIGEGSRRGPWRHCTARCGHAERYGGRTPIERSYCTRCITIPAEEPMGRLQTKLQRSRKHGARLGFDAIDMLVLVVLLAGSAGGYVYLQHTARRVANQHQSGLLPSVAGAARLDVRQRRRARSPPHNPPPRREVWALLKAGGQVVLMRHDRTDSGSGDPGGFQAK